MTAARITDVITGETGKSRYCRSMRNLDAVFRALSASSFRQRFRLGEKERAYSAARGGEDLAAQARQIIRSRLRPAHPKNDGKQTPMRGHPVFIAQHATATCCRGCLAKWHAIPAGRPLEAPEEAHVLAAIMRWIEQQLAVPAATERADATRQLSLDLDLLR